MTKMRLLNRKKPAANNTADAATERPLPLNTVLHGDCREILPTLRPNSVDLIFADPPYNLQLRGELWRPDLSHVDAVTDDWDKFNSFADYDRFTRDWLNACRHVLKETGTLWVIGSYHNIYRVGSILQDLGYWILNDVAWIKCLSAGTRVYAKTQKGEMPMTIKDMVRLEPATVQLWNGTNWTQVHSWEQSKQTEGLQIELRNGERLRCTPEHRWPTQRGVLPANELKIGDVIETCQLPEPVDTARPAGLDDELVGWFVGLYLAEGTRHEGTISIASHIKETERFARLRELATAYHGQCTMQAVRENGCSFHLHGPILNAILDMYISGNTAKGKHLNVRCWQRSDCFLRSILQGYLSGDGHYDALNNRWRLGLTRNYAWEADLRTLCARLGIGIRLKDGRTALMGTEFEMLRGEIRFERKANNLAKHDTEILKIGTAVSEQYWDIAVEEEPHLFALASGILTHNSNPMPNFKGTRFCNAHETMIWAKKSEKQTKYTFNYKSMKAGNEDLQMRSDWNLPICTGEERLKENGEKAHATQKPEALLHRIVRACSNPGDIILDPFFGTGTTGAVAKSLRRNWIGIEKEQHYSEIAHRRIEQIVPPLVPDELLPPPLDAPKLKIPFAMLLEYGLLHEGTILQLGRTDFMACVLEDGTIVCNQYRGSIHKVAAQCQGKPSANGWDAWYYRDKTTGETRVLDTLREQARKMMGISVLPP